MSHEQPSTNPAEYDPSVDWNNQRYLEKIKHAETMNEHQSIVQYPDASKDVVNRAVLKAEAEAKGHYQRNKDQIMTNARIEMEADQRADEARGEAHKAIDESQELAAH